MKMEERRASTPPSLDGTVRRIAYAKRKYHSGTMWGGVIRGLAGIKLSASIKNRGQKKIILSKAVKSTEKPKASLIE